jgi:TolA-binding protein
MSINWIRRTLWAAVLGSCVSASAAPYVILQGNQRVDGVSIRVKPDGSIVLTDAAGQQRTLARAQIVRAVADKPAGMDQAIQQVQAGKFDLAIPVLEKIVSDMRFLSWDQQAVVPLTQALTAKDPARAVSVFENVLKDNPQLENSPARWTYYSALVAANRVSELEPKLDALIRTGPAADAARAQLLRGDLRTRQNQMEAAVLDYLRTVTFYETETALMPEALYKTADTLEKMRDARCRDWYKRLVDEFPDSPQAVEARGKMN